MLVIGLFPSAASAAQCLDNLAEADFSANDISLVMKTKSAVEEISDARGRLTGLQIADLARKLTELGRSAIDVQSYVQGVRDGGVFIAIDTSDDDVAAAAEEMLQDGNARHIREIQ